MTSKGLYFVANDKAITWVIPFLNSIKIHCPGLPLCLIPFDDEIGLLSKLQDLYGFSILNQPVVLAKCDEISQMFHGGTCRLYRKIAAWAGNYDEFVYIDTDTVLTHEIDWIFPLLKSYPILLADGPTPSNRKYVWRESISTVGNLTPDQIAFSANMGFFASKKEVFTIEKIESVAREAAQIKEHMDLNSGDQSFMNYLFVTAGVRYTSCRTLLNLGIRKTRMAWWGGSTGGIAFGGKIFILAHKGKILLGKWPIFLVHWAGDATKIYIGKSAWNDLAQGNYVNRRGLVTWFRYRSLWEYYAFAKSARCPNFTIADVKRLAEEPSNLSLL